MPFNVKTFTELRPDGTTQTSTGSIIANDDPDSCVRGIATGNSKHELVLIRERQSDLSGYQTTHTPGTWTFEVPAFYREQPNIVDTCVYTKRDKGIVMSPLIADFTGRNIVLARAKAYDKINLFNGLLFISEIDKTVAMFQQVSKRFADLTAFLGIQKSMNGFSRRRYLSSMFLEYQYGVKPLIADIEDAQKLLKRLVKRRVYYPFNFDPPIEQRGEFSEFSGSHDGSITSFPYIRAEHKAHRVGFRAGGLIRTGIAPEGLAVLGNVPGFDPRQLLVTRWELIRYSFVVDYFVKVGDYLKALSLCTYSQELVYAWYTTEAISSVTTSYRKDESKHYGGSYLIGGVPTVFDETSSYVVNGSSHFVQTRAVRRGNLKDAPLSSFRLTTTLPSAAKVLNLIALFDNKAYKPSLRI